MPAWIAGDDVALDAHPVPIESAECHSAKSSVCLLGQRARRTARARARGFAMARPGPDRTAHAARHASSSRASVHPRLNVALDMRRTMQAQVEHYRRVLACEEVIYQPLKLR